MHYLLGRAYNRVRRRYGQDKWTADQLMVEIRAGLSDAPVTDPEDTDLEEDPTVGALLWLINATLVGSHLFDDYANLPVQELLRPGRLTVLQLNEIA